MVVDKLLAMFDNREVTAVGGIGSDSIDTSVASWKAQGNPLYFCVSCALMDATTGNETYQVKLQDADAVGGTGNLTTGIADVPGTVFTFTRGATGANMPKRSEFQWVQINAPENLKRYLWAAAVFGGTSPRADVTAWLTFERPPMQASYPDSPMRRYTGPTN